jgi:hypothetical protein
MIHTIVKEAKILRFVPGKTLTWRASTPSQLALSEFKEQNHQTTSLFGRKAVVREQNRLYIHTKEKRPE